MNQRLLRFVSAGALPLVILLTADNAAAIERVRCESINHHYRFCPANAYNGIQLLQETSEARCTFGSSWGYERGGIWVNHGCRAVFGVGGHGNYVHQPYSSAYFGRPRYRDTDNHYYSPPRRPYWAPPRSPHCRTRPCIVYQPLPRVPVERPLVNCPYGLWKNGKCSVDYGYSRGRAKEK